MKDAYKIIENFPLYKIYPDGKIVRKAYYDSKNRFWKEKQLTNILGRDNYYKIMILDKNLNRKNMVIHRLVAIAFLENKENKPQVNHKDGNTLNNNVDNLEWVTQSENMKHSYDLLNHKKVTKITGDVDLDFYVKQKIKQTNHCREVECITTNQIFFSSTEAGRQLGVSQSCVSACCNNKIKSTKGLQFRFTNQNKYSQRKKVKCLESGIVYESINKASSKLNISGTSIVECCNKKKKSAHGLHFQFID